MDVMCCPLWSQYCIHSWWIPSLLGLDSAYGHLYSHHISRSDTQMKLFVGQTDHQVSHVECQIAVRTSGLIEIECTRNMQACLHFSTLRDDYNAEIKSTEYMH